MCGRNKDEVVVEVDHVIPVASGGTDELENLATLCRDCNRGKSAYRFTDYRGMAVVPDGIVSAFRFFHDDCVGDFDRFHYYLYYKVGVHAGDTDAKYHHTWTISRTQLASSSNSVALIERRKSEESLKFVRDIRLQLIASGKRLIKNEEGICQIDG